MNASAGEKKRQNKASDTGRRTALSRMRGGFPHTRSPALIPAITPYKD